MATDFSGAPINQGGELIPENAIAWATLNIRPKSVEFNKILHSGKENADNKYLDCEIEITHGPFAGRKVYHMLGVAGSEKWVNMSMAGIRHILEVGKKAGPDNPQGYVLGANLQDGDERMWMELDGLQCAIKVGVEKGGGEYRDKNRVKSFLSPNPDSPTSKDFKLLVEGAHTSGPAEKPKAAISATPWGAGTVATQTTTQQQPAAQSSAAGGGRPGWAGTPPPKDKAAPF